jgi:phosphotransferase system IIB component
MIIYNEIILVFSLVGAAIGVAFVIVVSLMVRPKRKKNPVYDVEGYASALGSINNIVAASVRGSRLYLELDDPRFVDVQALKALGVASVITMSRKVVLVIGDEAATIAYLIQERIKTRS